MLAHLSTKVLHVGKERAKVKSELVRAVWALEPSTERMLLAEIAQIDPNGTAPLYMLHGLAGHPPGLVLQAAMQAERKIATRGDYTNVALERAIAYLVLIWALLGDKEVSVARRVLIRPTGGSFSTEAASPCGKFILEFFRAVDPGLNVSTVTNALATRYAYLNREGISRPEDHRLDVVKHLSGEEAV